MMVRMPQRFNYVRREELPRLAWCLRMIAGADQIEVIHGPGVETRPSYFVEGAWRGRFEDGRFDESEVLLGSGARLASDTLTVASTSHTLERLHSLHTGSTLVVSNSLAFLLAVTGEECTDDYVFYDLDLISFLDGLHARKAIPLKSGRRIRLHYCCNLVVDSALTLHEDGKRPFIEQPSSYEEYVKFLQCMVHDVVANAASSARSVRYSPVVTVSSGYDSPACAVLARHAGATRAGDVFECSLRLWRRRRLRAPRGPALGSGCTYVRPLRLPPSDRSPRGRVPSSWHGRRGCSIRRARKSASEWHTLYWPSGRHGMGTVQPC